jgi:predicted component of type VI protein secretion system
MRAFNTICCAVLIGVVPVLSGCQTTAPKKSEINVKVGEYKAAQTSAVGNDIKNILAQGGLDTSNPGSSSVASATDPEIKTLSTNATSLETLVAQLDSKTPASLATETAAAQTPIVHPNVAKSPAARQPAEQKQTALALAEVPKPSVIENIETTVFQPINMPPIAAPQTAAVDLPVAKPAPRIKKKPRVVETASTPPRRKPAVERF